MSPSLAKRLLVAAVGIPAAFGLVYVGGWVLAALLWRGTMAPMVG